MSKKNPFDKYLRPEDHVQLQVAQWMKLQHPHVPWVHTPNEAKRTPFERYLFKLFGCLKGTSDILVFRPSPHFNGLAVEIKVQYPSGGKNYPTATQKDFLRALRDEGWCCAVTWGFDETTKVIDDYLSGRVPQIKYKF